MDITKKVSFENVKNWYNDLINKAEKGCIIALIGNKLDLVERKEKMRKNKLLKTIMAKTYPSINFRKKLYLKREYKTIDLKYIEELLDFLNGKILAKKGKNHIDNLIQISEENKHKPLYYEKIEKTENPNYITLQDVLKSSYSDIVLNGNGTIEFNEFFEFINFLVAEKGYSL